MWPVKINDITRLQIEISSFCNAKCSACERVDFFSFNNGYVKQLNSNYVSCNDLQKWIDLYDFSSLQSIHLCGNIDEPTLNPELFSIIDYINFKFKNVKIFISTNGGTKNEKFWIDLSKKQNVICIFGIDGLEDTNHIYRINVNWKKLERNFKKFIHNGGKAIWQFIVFDFNEHQIDLARKKSEEENFIAFQLKYSGRDNENVKHIRKNSKTHENIICKATYNSKELEKSFFIDYQGNLWPCCWMGSTYNSNEFYEKISKHYGGLLSNNLNYSFFDEIIEGDSFSTLYSNFQKMSVCNKKCKNNFTDVDFFIGNNDKTKYEINSKKQNTI